jgi:hypothetical protein
MEHILRLHANLLFTILLVFSVLALWALILGLLRASGWSVAPQWHGDRSAARAVGMRPRCDTAGARVTAAPPEMHILYGIIALLTIPIAHSSARNREPRSQGLMYAFACMFVCIIALRAVEMARP